MNEMKLSSRRWQLSSGGATPRWQLLVDVEPQKSPAERKAAERLIDVAPKLLAAIVNVMTDEQLDAKMSSGVTTRQILAELERKP